VVVLDDELTDSRDGARIHKLGKHVVFRSLDVELEQIDLLTDELREAALRDRASGSRDPLGPGAHPERRWVTRILEERHLAVFASERRPVNLDAL